jgi:apolipoprotein N-acyltransferase
MTVFYLIIPAAFVFFYGSKNVKATCEFRDSQVRWTDKCPLPVLAVSFIFGLWAVSMLLAGLCGWLIPFFGSILSGMTGALVSLVAALLYLYVVWGTYKLNIRA